MKFSYALHILVIVSLGSVREIWEVLYLLVSRISLLELKNRSVNVPFCNVIKRSISRAWMIIFRISRIVGTEAYNTSGFGRGAAAAEAAEAPALGRGVIATGVSSSE